MTIGQGEALIIDITGAEDQFSNTFTGWVDVDFTTSALSGVAEDVTIPVELDGNGEALGVELLEAADTVISAQTEELTAESWNAVDTFNVTITQVPDNLVAHDASADQGEALTVDFSNFEDMVGDNMADGDYYIEVCDTLTGNEFTVPDVTFDDGEASPEVLDGAATADISADTYDDVEFSITVDGVTVSDTADITINQVVSAGNSSASADPTTLPADGTSISTLTIEVEDLAGEPIEGLEEGDFDISDTGDADVKDFEDLGNGEYTFDITNTTAETITLTIEVDNVELDDNPEIEFTPYIQSIETTEAGANAFIGDETEDGHVVVVANVIGEAGHEIQVEFKAEGNNTPLSVDVDVDEKYITVNLETDVDGNAVSTSQEVADAINADDDASVLVTAYRGGNGEGIAVAGGPYTLHDGENAVLTITWSEDVSGGDDEDDFTFTQNGEWVNPSEASTTDNITTLTFNGVEMDPISDDELRIAAGAVNVNGIINLEEIWEYNTDAWQIQ